MSSDVSLCQCARARNLNLPFLSPVSHRVVHPSDPFESAARECHLVPVRVVHWKDTLSASPCTSALSVRVPLMNLRENGFNVTSPTWVSSRTVTVADSDARECQSE